MGIRTRMEITIHCSDLQKDYSLHGGFSLFFLLVFAGQVTSILYIIRLHIPKLFSLNCMCNSCPHLFYSLHRSVASFILHISNLLLFALVCLMQNCILFQYENESKGILHTFALNREVYFHLFSMWSQSGTFQNAKFEMYLTSVPVCGCKIKVSLEKCQSNHN